MHFFSRPLTSTIGTKKEEPLVTFQLYTMCFSFLPFFAIFSPRAPNRFFWITLLFSDLLFRTPHCLSTDALFFVKLVSTRAPRFFCLLIPPLSFLTWVHQQTFFCVSLVKSFPISWGFLGRWLNLVQVLPLVIYHNTMTNFLCQSPLAEFWGAFWGHSRNAISRATDKQINYLRSASK